MKLLFLFWTLFLSAGSAIAESSCSQLYVKISQAYTPQFGMHGKLDVFKLQAAYEALLKRFPGKIEVTEIGKVGKFPMLKVRLPSKNPHAKRLLITTGIHGNEVLAPVAVKEYVQKALEKGVLQDHYDITVYPMTNPRALAQGNRRWNNDPSLDLNRQFLKTSKEPEVQLLTQDLGNQNFDVALDVHGAPTKQHFFAIASGEDWSYGRKAIEKFPKELLLESNDGQYPGAAGIPSDPLRYKMFARGIAQSHLPNTLKDYFFRELKVPNSYVLEYPGRNEPNSTVQFLQDFLEAFTP